MKPATIRALELATGMDRRNIPKFLARHGLTLSMGMTKLTKIIKEHQRARESQQELQVEDDEREIDKSTGLKFSKALVAEKLRTERLANNEREMQQSKDWTRTDEMLSIIKNLCTKLDQAPAKCKSQLGLTTEQTTGLQKILDDLRAEFAKEL